MTPKKTAQKILNWLLLLAVAAALVPAKHVVAKDEQTITVAPAFLKVSVSDKSPISEQTVSIRNDFSTDVSLSAQVSAVQIVGGKIVPTSKSSASLDDSIRLSETEFFLRPKQSINLKILFQNNNKLQPGGHYGAILIKTTGSNSSPSVSFQPVINIGLYLVKEDGAKRSLQVQGINQPYILFGLPGSVNVTFNNTGNVTVTPRASVSYVKNNLTYAKGVANDGSLPVMPYEKLNLKVDMQKLKAAWLPGKYKLTVNYRHEEQPEPSTYTKDVILLPTPFIATAVIFVALLYLAIKNNKSLKKYARKMHRKQPKKPIQTGPKSMDIIVTKKPPKTP